MKGSDGHRMRLVFVGFVVALVLSDGQIRADFMFGEPIHLGSTINSRFHDGAPAVSADGLELYFASDRPGGQGDLDIWVSRRITTNDDWGVPVNLGPTVNSTAADGEPSISADGLELFFSSGRAGGLGNADLYVARRTTIHHDWSEPLNLGPSVNTPSADYAPSLTSDGLTLYFDSNRAGGSGKSDIWMTTRNAIGDPWAEAMNLGSIVNTGAQEISPCVSADGLWLLFRSWKGGGQGNCDLWLSTRTTTSEPWSVPVNLAPPVNSRSCEHDPSISADGLTLFFGSNDRPGQLGGEDLWQVSITRIVDFNGDSSVDGDDILTLVEHWGGDNSLCDIGPMPWGNGVVDVEDLKVLAGYIGPDLDDPTLLAHWALDETEGLIASDSVADNDGTVIGTPVWQPAGGQVNGALEFDGVTYIAADQILSPSEGPFSVLAWIRGRIAGQVVVSQTDGSDWLTADALEGTLATGLAPSARNPLPPLVSDTIITDGDWHRIAFTWDGAYRRLYVDDVLVAEREDVGLAECYGDLNIGCGKDTAPESLPPRASSPA